tara:strand:+ start:1555 stop:1788 length:234 start_codon:yes stop_codon:yes gene_type:complete
MEIRESIKIWLADALGCSSEEIHESGGIGNTPGWDSFGHLNVMMELEKRFGISIDDDTVRRYQTVKAIEELVEEKGS